MKLRKSFKKLRWGWKGKKKAERSSRLLQQVMPSDEAYKSDHESSPKRRNRNVDRPGFSLTLMTNNFRRFNAR